VVLKISERDDQGSIREDDRIITIEVQITGRYIGRFLKRFPLVERPSDKDRPAQLLVFRTLGATGSDIDGSRKLSPGCVGKDGRVIVPSAKGDRRIDPRFPTVG